MTKVINLIGSPSAGKSTTAAGLYAKMKALGYSVELVREAAKDYAWEGRKISYTDQIALAGEQIRREGILYGKVDYIITDSPILLAPFYLKRNHGDPAELTNFIFAYYKFKTDVEFINVWIDRNKKYDQNGRFESEEDALLLDKELYNYVKDYYGYNLIKIEGLHKDQQLLKIITKTCGFCSTQCTNNQCTSRRK